MPVRNLSPVTGPPASSFPNARVVAALRLQVAGYAALLALFPHSSPSGVADAVARAPSVVLIPLAIPAIPATLSTIAVGAVGPAPESIPAIVLARGDVLFFASAYVAGVAAAWADRNARPTDTAGRNYLNRGLGCNHSYDYPPPSTASRSFDSAFRRCSAAVLGAQSMAAATSSWLAVRGTS